jgi:hypothetical protein
MILVRRLAVVAVSAAVIATAAAKVGAQSADPPTARSSEIEWKRRIDPHLRPGIEGWVSNPSGYRVASVPRRDDVLDRDNRVVEERRAWVYGHVPAGGRGFFVIALAPDDKSSDRIAVDSFDLISREAP